MRVRNWNPKKYDPIFAEASMDRIRTGAALIAAEIRVRCPVGTVSRPMYKTGRYEGKDWTMRDAGMLKRSIRVVEKEETGWKVWQDKDVRVYVGHYLAWYAQIVEYYTPFVRPAWRSSLSVVKSVIATGSQVGVRGKGRNDPRGYAAAKGRSYR